MALDSNDIAADRGRCRMQRADVAQTRFGREAARGSTSRDCRCRASRGDRQVAHATAGSRATIRKSLRRRILLANLLGLAGLLFAMLYLSLHHGWLLDAKVDVVKTVSRITAEAIAYRAVNERAIFDPNRLPEKTAAAWPSATMRLRRSSFRSIRIRRPLS